MENNIEKVQAFNVIIFFGIILVSVLAAVLYDIYLIDKYGTEGSISFALEKFGKKYPIIAFLFGFISGLLTFALAVHFWNF